MANLIDKEVEVVRLDRGHRGSYHPARVEAFFPVEERTSPLEVEFPPRLQQDMFGVRMLDSGPRGYSPAERTEIVNRTRILIPPPPSQRIRLTYDMAPPASQRLRLIQDEAGASFQRHMLPPNRRMVDVFLDDGAFWPAQVLRFKSPTDGTPPTYLVELTDGRRMRLNGAYCRPHVEPHERYAFSPEGV